MIANYASLAGRIREELKDIERVVTRAEEMVAKAQTTSDDAYFDGAALNLHSFYTGLERIFESIAREMDDSVPSGIRWHQDLLMQMSAEISGIRPPVISAETRLILDEYRGFRHLVRHIYTFKLNSRRIERLVEGLRGVYRRVREEILGFAEFLEQLAGK
jgi:hypothetical protein